MSGTKNGVNRQISEPYVHSALDMLRNLPVGDTLTEVLAR